MAALRSATAVKEGEAFFTPEGPSQLVVAMWWWPEHLSLPMGGETLIKKKQNLSPYLTPYFVPNPECIYFLYLFYFSPLIPFYFYAIKSPINITNLIKNKEKNVLKMFINL